MPFYTALSGLTAASSELGVIGNNVANSSTPGFKKSRAEFADVYAATSSGAGSSAVGTGVILQKVSQQFAQGNITFTDSKLDMAINGNGFFVLNDSGSIAYSRAGTFGVDSGGYIVNASNQRLTGFLADSSGAITGAQGDLQINTANLSPKATDDIGLTTNLDASATPPTTAFTTGFTPDAPPSPNSYNSTTSMTVYDSLGNSHIMTAYFVKAHTLNEWRVYMGIDGEDVTPTTATPPSGTPPVSYPSTDLAAPFTLKFTDAGAFINNNPTAPPQYYGAGPATSTATPLSTSGTLATIDLGDLTINGIAIDAAESTSDVFSTTDKSASAISNAAAINASSTLHGVTATPNATSLDLGAFTAGDYAAGDFTINNRQIVGTIANNTDLLNLINAETALTGVSAADVAGSIVLTASDSRNIQVQTDGTTASSATFANFDTNGGVALDQVQRATVSLSTNNNEAIVIGGANPADIGFGAGPQAGILYSNSDVVSLSNWDPGTGATLQNFDIDLSASTQFGAPFSVVSLTQDGYSTGRLSSVAVDADGIIIARYSNGQSQSLGQVALANFGNEQGLEPLGDTAWSETFSSGAALIGAPGSSSLGVIQAGALEESNVGLTDELVALIVAQRNFQANAQTIQTADAVTQTIINIR